jgi:hypothetical protein
MFCPYYIFIGMNKRKLKRAIRVAGSPKLLSEYLGCSKQYINQVTNYYGMSGTENSVKRPLSKKYWDAVDRLIVR